MKNRTKTPQAAQSLASMLALAFFALSVVAILISGGLQLVSNFQTQQKVISSNQQLIAQDAARIVSSFIQEKFSSLETTIWLTDPVPTSRAEQEQILDSLLGLQPAFRQLALLDAQDQALAQASRLSVAASGKLTERLEAGVLSQIQRRQRYIGPVYIDQVTGEPLLIMAVPVIDVFERFQGTLVAEVNLKFMWDLVDQLKVGEAGQAYVVDRRGNLIAFGDTARVLRGENVSHLLAVNEFIQNPGTAHAIGVSQYSGIAGATAVGTYAALETPDWAVVTELPWEEAYREIIQEVVVSIGITLAIALAAGLVGAYTARRLAVPLVDLTETASRIAGGERELQAVVSGPREVASLATAFNSMTAQLQQSLVSLEQRVVEVKRTTDSLRRANETLQALIDYSPLAILMLDLDSRVLLWNHAAEKMYGWTPDEVLGSFLPNVSQGKLEEHLALRDRVLSGETLTNLELERRRKDGSTFMIGVSISPLRDSEGNVYAQMSIATDITDRKWAEEIIQLRLRLMEFAATHSLGELLQKTLDEVGELTNSPIGFYHFVEADQKTLSLQAWSTRTLEEFCRAEGRGMHYPLDQAGVWTDCVRERRPVIHNDYQSLPHRKGFPEGHAQVIRELVVPIIRGDRIVAILGVGNRPRDYTEKDVEIVSYVADVAWEIAERKRAEETLRMFQYSIDQASDAIEWLNREGGFEYVNEQACRSLGYTREELMRLRLWDIDPIYPRQLWDQNWEQYEQNRQGATEHLETLHRRKDGVVFPVEVVAKHMWFGDRPLHVAFVRDITERKRTEEALRESEERYRTFVENLPVGVYRTSPGAKGKHLLANSFFVRMFGYSSLEDVQRIDVADMYLNPAERKIFSDSLLATGHVDRVELQLKRSDGTPIWGAVTASVAHGTSGEVYFDCAIEDITERKRAEDEIRRLNTELEQRVVERTQQLQEALAFQKEIMTASSTGIVAYDASGQCVLANEAAAKMVDGSLEQVLAQNYHRIESWQKSGLYATALEAFESRTEKQKDIHVVSSFGKEAWLHCRFSPFDSGGQPHLLLTINDLTERMRAEAEIRELNQQLQTQANNLATANRELEAFAYSISHDLRAPLRAIDGYTRILEDDYAPRLDAEGLRVCDVVRNETRRMGQLIDGLLAFSRLSRAEMQTVPIDMAALVNAAFNELATPESRARIDFGVGTLPPAIGDPTLIRQVWTNLLGNAIKFSSKQERAVIAVGGRQEAHETLYWVRDNGAGFDMQYAHKLFGVFQRLHSEREFEGTGVGLAIVQRIIHRHGGRVWAESEVGQGATLYFTLPGNGD